jgi:hypothetical protein
MRRFFLKDIALVAQAFQPAEPRVESRLGSSSIRGCETPARLPALQAKARATLQFEIPEMWGRFPNLRPISNRPVHLQTKIARLEIARRMKSCPT